jgi:hypothetical protein
MAVNEKSGNLYRPSRVTPLANKVLAFGLAERLQRIHEN